MEDLAPQDAPGCGPRLDPGLDERRPLRQQVFECVRAAGALARVDVAKALDVSPATVTSLVSDLIESGLLREHAVTRETGRGRPRVSLAVVPDAHVVVGMKLSDREHTAVLCDFSGTMIAQVTVNRETPFADRAALLQLVEDVVDAVCAEGGVRRSAVSALGIGVPGFVEHQTGRVNWSPLIAAEPFDLVASVTARLGLPTTVDNDANLATLAELWFGAGRDTRNFAVVTIEHGVGMGMVINHQLFRGANGLGLELAHTKVQIEGALCRCGQRGCLEAYVADYALAREAATALGTPMDAPLDGGQIVEQLYAKAVEGHPGAQSIFRRAGSYLALGLANVANLFDPQRIILSGARMKYDLLYTADVLAEVERLSLDFGVPAADIEVRRWGDLIWAQGAAALALDYVTGSVLAD